MVSKTRKTHLNALVFGSRNANYDLSFHFVGELLQFPQRLPRRSHRLGIDREFVCVNVTKACYNCVCLWVGYLWVQVLTSVCSML